MLHQVGVGVLGPVFRTYEPTRDRLVAVKVFRLDITPEAARTLADELSRAAEAGLFHPSVVEPIAAGVEGTVAYRAEEYVAAESLDVAMRHHAPASLDKVLAIVTQMAAAVDFARGAGVGHGALHPRDVFVSPDDTRVTGFGVVEALERAGLRAPVRRPYSAPERLAGEPWATPADIFSVAAITYELLTGRRPAGTGAQIGALDGDAESADGSAVFAVLARAMAEAPEDRYASAGEFVAALDAAGRGELPPPAEAAAAAPIAAAETAEPQGQGALPAPSDAEDDSLVEEADDDIAVERDEDDAYIALVEEEHSSEEEPPADRDPFDNEALEDLAIRGYNHGDEETERFADEFAAASAVETSTLENEGHQTDAFVPPAPPITPIEDHVRPVVPDRQALSHLAVAGLVALALLVGFAAGHMLGSRGAQGRAAAVDAERNPAESKEESPARPYSEEPVTPAVPVASTPPAVDEPTAPAAAPASSPQTGTEAVVAAGRLIVRSAPSGAGVTVDGRWRGRTPLTLDDLPFGSYVVRVVQPGYQVASGEVVLSSSEPTKDVSYRLRRAPASSTTRSTTAAVKGTPSPSGGAARYTGSVYVDSLPRGARVLVNGRPVGTTPVLVPEVPVGSQIIRLQLDGHRDWTTTTRVIAGQQSKVSGSLERIR